MADKKTLYDMIENSNNPAWCFFPDNREIIRFVDYLLAKGVAVQQWIPVTERLPEADMDVLAFNGDYIFVSRYYCSHFASWDKEGHMAWVKDQYAKDPTHWLPLPEPPKEELIINDTGKLLMNEECPYNYQCRAMDCLDCIKIHRGEKEE